ncbi:chaperone required for assembly of F1-ATPase [Cereibacter ovatus]|uniref:Chaperone required for assembly of F1-ATPase n=1 Tax=Cereibacter ovatus TaxID=439529 RepID=A0A285CLT1_9RHOB|nr:ATP12 family protein [Cereibacter ovatus]SNX68512.1 chaperone required for assembly of F1-ATPase [Cereibacter ovatus]
MAGWTAKRFWQQAVVVPEGAGFRVTLDGRPVRTPAKTPLILPSRPLAEAIAAEWQAQDGTVRPETMPFTRSANSALDKVAVQFDEVAEMLAAYGETDLLCYRAAAPAALTQRQADAWDPLLDWAARALSAPLHATVGVIPQAQPGESLSRLAARVHALSPFQLAAFHDLVAISGSLVIALAVIDGRLTAEDGWAVSRVDESWQSEQWGEDDEAAEVEACRREAFLHAARFFALCG